MVNCANCFKPLYKPNHKKTEKSFCSWACNMDAQRKRRPIRICLFCKKPFKKKCRNDAKWCSWECRKNCPENIQQLAIMRKKQGSNKENNLEKKGYKILEDLNLKFYKQYIFGKRFVADAYIEDLNLLVQFDGDYWHGNSKVFKNLTERQKKQIIIDGKANELAAKTGYNILRFWENDLSFEFVQYNISKLIQENSYVPPPDRRGPPII